MNEKREYCFLMHWFGLCWVMELEWSSENGKIAWEIFKINDGGRMELFQLPFDGVFELRETESKAKKKDDGPSEEIKSERVGYRNYVGDFLRRVSEEGRSWQDWREKEGEHWRREGSTQEGDGNSGEVE